MKKIILIRGPLGVGKSTISKKIAKQLDALYISVDNILDTYHLIQNENIPIENFLQANEIIEKNIMKSNKKICIIDGNFYYQEQLDDIIKKFNRHIQIFTLLSSLEICINRDAQRIKPYGIDATQFVHMMTTKINIGEIIDNSTLTIDETIEKILETL